MEDELLTVYRELATTLDALLPVAWKEIYLYACVYEAGGSYELAIVPKDETELVFATDYPEWVAADNEFDQWEDVYWYVQELRTIFLRFEQQPFTDFYFYLSNSGAIAVEYEAAEACESNDEQRQRLKVFREKIIG